MHAFTLRRYPSQLTAGRRNSALVLKAAIESVRDDAFADLVLKLRSPGGLRATSGHALPFVEWVLNEASTKEDPRAFAQAFLSRSTGLTTTPAGISALMFEQWIAQKSRKLFQRFVETVVEKKSYLIVFEGPIDEREFEQMQKQTESFVKEFKVMVAYGHRAEDGMISDLTVLEATPVENLKPDALKAAEKDREKSAMTTAPDARMGDLVKARDSIAPRTEAEYFAVADEGGLSSSAFGYVFGDPTLLSERVSARDYGLSVVDPNGVEWVRRYDREKWVPKLKAEAVTTPPGYHKAAAGSWQSCETCSYFDTNVGQPGFLCTNFDVTVQKNGLCDAWDGNETGQDESIEEVTSSETLARMAADHNDTSGDKGRVTAATLQAVFDRGVGAYRTNPGSVRPNVKSPEQWAYARVNNFLRTIRTGKFRSGEHDTDLLPSKHPLSTRSGAKKESYESFDSGLIRSTSGSWAVFESPVEGGPAGTVVVAEQSAWLLSTTLERVNEVVDQIAACYEPDAAWAEDRCIEHALAEWGSSEGREIENIDECLAVANPDVEAINERDEFIRSFLGDTAPSTIVEADKKTPPPPPAAPEEEEPTDRMDDPEFYRDDIQVYYDIQILSGVDPNEAVKKTKQRFKLKKLIVLPTGEVRAPDVVDRPTPPPMLPPEGGEMMAPPAPLEQPDGVPDTGAVAPPMPAESIADLLDTIAEEAEDAEHDGQRVTLNKPSRIQAGQPSYGKKKFQVYVRNDAGNVVRVVFGDPNLEIKRDDPERRANFRARHSCDDNPGPRWKARYWSCKMWQAGKSVGDMLDSLDEVAAIVSAMAQKTGKSQEEAERLWQKAGEIASKNYDVEPESESWYAIKVGIFKRMMGVAAESVRSLPSSIDDAFHRWVESDDGNTTEFDEWLNDNYPQLAAQLADWTPSNIHEGSKGASGLLPEQSERYEKWRRLVNMSNKDIRDVLREVTTSASVGGMRSAILGRKSARRLLSMRARPVESWTAEDWEWAGRQVNAIRRLRASPGPLIDERGDTEKLSMLRLWGHEPRTRAAVSESAVLVGQRTNWRCQSCQGPVFESDVRYDETQGWLHTCGVKLSVPAADEEARRFVNRTLIDATPGSLPCAIVEGAQVVPSFDLLRQNRVELTKQERSYVMRKKATWVYESRRHPLPAIWKSIVNGQSYFVSNTHRAYAVSTSVASAVARHHAVIKPTT